jgi:YD repeat-containing protein
MFREGMFTPVVLHRTLQRLALFRAGVSRPLKAVALSIAITAAASGRAEAWECTRGTDGKKYECSFARKGPKWAGSSRVYLGGPSGTIDASSRTRALEQLREQMDAWIWPYADLYMASTASRVCNGMMRPNGFLIEQVNSISNDTDGTLLVRYGATYQWGETFQFCRISDGTVISTTAIGSNSGEMNVVRRDKCLAPGALERNTPPGPPYDLGIVSDSQDYGVGICYYARPTARPNQCFGNPITATGVKLQKETDWVSASGPLRLERVYTNRPLSIPSVRRLGRMDASWMFNHQRYLNFEGGQITLQHEGDVRVSFPAVVGSTAKQTNRGYALQPYANGYFVYGPDNVLEVFDANGGLRAAWTHSGRGQTVQYRSTAGVPAGVIESVVEDFGRQLSFVYRQPTKTGDPPVLTQVSLPNGSVIAYEIEEVTGVIQKATLPDASFRDYGYQILSDYGNLPLLTSVGDELRKQSTFAYNANGVATTTQRAGGVDRWQVADNRSYGIGAVNVTSPANSQFTLNYTVQSGYMALSSQNQPPGSGCGASVSRQTNDANGNVDSVDDFNGHRVCYAHDQARSLELVRVEGLAGGTACTSTAAGSALPAGARKVSTQWHPLWRLATRVAEPGRITTSVYNGQPDPFSGNTIASCAPPSAVLPDGSRIAVLCRQVEQATTDSNGALGFTAALQPGVAVREQHWTYNEFGQMLTHDRPRTDVADTTVYEYYTTTAFTGTDPNAVGVTRGDLKKVTPPTGGHTLYKLYNKLGQVLETEDANGVITTYTYDLRQRMTSMTLAGQTTVYDYWPTGLIKRITQPDASWVSYDHDDAHRLVKVSDNLGHSITYTLDNMGNRVDEQVKDPGGALRRNLARGIDALGRVQQVTGRE